MSRRPKEWPRLVSPMALMIYTVYQRPDDFPDHFVVRASTWWRDVEYVAMIAGVYDTFEEIRGEADEQGLAWLTRQPADEPAILGVFL